MLSFRRGTPIAEIQKGNKVVKTVYVTDIDNEKSDIDSPIRDQVLPKSFYTNLRNINAVNMILLKKAIRESKPDIMPRNANMHEAYKQAQLILEDLLRKYIQIPKEEGTMQPIPIAESFRFAIFGPSGVGKSTFLGRLMMEYKKKYKKNDIFVVSALTEDEAFEKAKPIYVKLDESVITDPMSIKEFKNSMVCFDDIESITNKALKEAVFRFRDECLQVGRHENIATVCIAHGILMGAESKVLLNEADEVCVFPRSNFSAISNLVKRYYGFGRDDVNYLKELGQRSRWAVVKRSFPSCIIGEQEVKVL